MFKKYTVAPVDDYLNPLFCLQTGYSAIFSKIK